MNTINHILTRSIAGPYYRQHAGFFLFLFFLFFGTQPSLYHAVVFHQAIMRSILSNTNFFLIAALLWTLYAARLFHFFHGCLQKNAFHFLHLLNAFSLSKRLICLFRLQTLLFAPVWSYTVFILVLAIKEKQYLSGLGIFVFLFLLSVITMLLFNWSLQHGSLWRWSVRSSLFRLPRNLFGFVLQFVWREQFIALLIIKLFSFFSLYALARLDATYYEDRILWLVFITALIGHSVIVYRNHLFLETSFFFSRNLPVKKIRRLLSLLGIYTLLLFPEIWALKGVAINQDQWMDYIWMMAAGPAVLLLMHSLLYTEDMKMEAYLQLLFGLWIVLVFFSLSAQRWLIPLLCTLMAGFVFLGSFYRYEKSAGVEKLE